MPKARARKAVRRRKAVARLCQGPGLWLPWLPSYLDPDFGTHWDQEVQLPQARNLTPLEH